MNEQSSVGNSGSNDFGRGASASRLAVLPVLLGKRRDSKMAPVRQGEFIVDYSQDKVRHKLSFNIF